ncbi:WGxxGxxG family protein [Nocardia blacklockiae]|uniref:WGxxGxxG family protein n=1 Tax=Nocardia blacklockiae TaxID=480036 RepID=UPI001893BE79|nr:WGxxGxxG family protein [Nocardia blacklockiae]MBF6175798.1 hypothetical protein [Nocardia blacklockiae]
MRKTIAVPLSALVLALGPAVVAEATPPAAPPVAQNTVDDHDDHDSDKTGLWGLLGLLGLGGLLGLRRPKQTSYPVNNAGATRPRQP